MPEACVRFEGHKKEVEELAAQSRNNQAAQFGVLVESQLVHTVHIFDCGDPAYARMIAQKYGPSPDGTFVWGVFGFAGDARDVLKIREILE